MTTVAPPRWANIMTLYVVRRLLPLFLALSALGFASDSLPPIEVNQNHVPAGIFRDGVLTIQLDIAKGEWHPEAEDGVGLSVYAFGETGHKLQNPGPLIRVVQGTEIRASLRNTLASSISVYGLSDSHTTDTPVRLAAGEIKEIKFRAAKPGLYFYWGASEVEDVKLRHGIDSELTGAFVVDPVGVHPDDEIFVMELMSERAGPGARENLATINGKSWPYSQHFQYHVGQLVQWRWINATNEPHSLHLHGFYFRIDAINRGGHVETHEPDARPLAVTQRIAQGETLDISWSPDRPGQWLFHCHMLIHMTPPIVPKLADLLTSPGNNHSDERSAMHNAGGMGQLVVGITVPDSNPALSGPAWHADRKLQLEISERPGLPRYALRVHDTAQPQSNLDKPGLIGPPIILTRGQPTEIEVVNQLKDPTAIHWHGIELDSYYDGVPGCSGADKQITPPILPGTSFIARMTPPRAGTFIYHTHWHDPSQLTNGIYGPLIVLPPGEKFDPASDLAFVFSIGDFGSLREIALINGTPQNKTLQLQAWKRYRFRLINISTNNQAMQISLRSAQGPMEWRILAKDGADLPSEVVRTASAQLTITVGETYDVEFASATAQDLQLDLLLPVAKVHVTQTLSFVAPTVPGSVAK
jgi:manganese oxidase